jgi:ankyrin repeat protein
MRRPRFVPPISIILFLAFVFVGTYCVRRLLLETAMGSALWMNDETMIRSLLSSWPCPVHAGVKEIPEHVSPMRMHWTPLHWSVWRGDLELVDRCLRKGADVNAKSFYGCTPLHIASADDGTLNEMMLPYGRVAVDVGDNCTGRPPRRVRRLDIAARLLAAGAYVNARDYIGWTPLHFAACTGDVGLVQLLIAKGADATAKADDGMTTLFLAASRGDVEVGRLLIEHGADLNAMPRHCGGPLFVTTESEFARLLIAKGSDVKVRDWDGRAALHEAVLLGGSLEVAQILIEKGADLDARDGAGETPLNLAARLSRSESVLFLLEKGADPDLADNAGLTPLHNAILAIADRYVVDIDVIEKLIEKGCDVNAKARDGRTPLDLAEHFPGVAPGAEIKRRLIEVLLKAGATTSLPEQPLMRD